MVFFCDYVYIYTMRSFLSKVAEQTLETHADTGNLAFILPNKRSGVFLRNLLKEKLPPTSFFPAVVSIDDFMKEVSGMEILDRISLVFEFYSVYKDATRADQAEKFESFSKWAGMLLQDFSEMDANLKEAKEILSYVHDAKRIEKWDPGSDGHTDLVSNYLAFYERLTFYYEALRRHLLEKRSGYQGLVYQCALDNLKSFLHDRPETRFVFAGFNALSVSEEKLIQGILENGQGEIYWDDDTFYRETRNQSDLFFQQYRKHWPFYKNHPFLWTEDQIDKPMHLELIGLPKNISQMKQVGSLLRQLYKKNTLENTAVILGNEKLLPSLLQSLPEEIAQANITMGFELQYTSLSNLFDSIFKLHLNRENWKREQRFYYKDLIRVLEDPFIKALWTDRASFSGRLKTLLYQEKSIFISDDQICSLAEGSPELVTLMDMLFSGWNGTTEQGIGRFLELIDLLRSHYPKDPLFREFLFRFHNVFTQLLNLNRKFGYIVNLNTLYQFYQQVLRTEKLSFEGEPLEGLQIMGLLESRVLDFENVIIASVNEGYLPSTGLAASFLPNEIKREKGLPTHKEKDAIFSYHFFRLLHRAKNVFLVYNNITDDFGSGEPSRFIKQLEVSKRLGHLQKVRISKKTLHPRLDPEPTVRKQVPKTREVMERLLEMARDGFSPSSLATYIRNPIDFYKRYVLRLGEYHEVEETLAANTFGTIVHETLYHLYEPLLGNFLSTEDLLDMKKKLHPEIEKQFRLSYSPTSEVIGKNYLSLEIARQFVLNFLNHELDELQAGKRIRLLHLEKELSCILNTKALPRTVRLRGKVDRIDQKDGVLRIIDYKTGKVSSSDLRIREWDKLIEEEKYGKAFQVLAYALMFRSDAQSEVGEVSLESGIISFKNLRAGFMKVNSGQVDQETLEAFLEQLDRLVLDIFDPHMPFVEKEIKQYTF